MTRKRKWLLGMVLVLATAADRLVALGDPGLAQLIAFVRAGDEASRAAAAAAIDRHLAASPEGEPRANAAAGRLLDAFDTGNDAGRRAVLELVPTILKRTGTAHAGRCREVVATGLRMADPATRVLAVRLALHPDLKLRAELPPLLSDPDAVVRRAALFAVASADGEPLITDEELFRWLHDPDEGVRKACRDALVSRDRTEAEIGLGRRLTDPDPGERLKLLLDLRYDDDVADPEPWLERLSRDPEPAVRAAAARVAVELTGDRRQACPAWVGRVADTDPDPTVRRVAGYFRRQPARPAGNDIRLTGGQ